MPRPGEGSREALLPGGNIQGGNSGGDSGGAAGLLQGGVPPAGLVLASDVAGPGAFTQRSLVRGDDFSKATAKVLAGLIGAGCLFSGTFCAFDSNVCPLSTGWWVSLVVLGFALLVMLQVSMAVARLLYHRSLARAIIASLTQGDQVASLDEQARVLAQAQKNAPSSVGGANGISIGVMVLLCGVGLFTFGNHRLAMTIVGATVVLVELAMALLLTWEGMGSGTKNVVAIVIGSIYSIIGTCLLIFAMGCRPISMQIEHPDERDHEVKLHELFAEFCPSGAGWWTILILGGTMLLSQFVIMNCTVQGRPETARAAAVGAAEDEPEEPAGTGICSKLAVVSKGIRDVQKGFGAPAAKATPGSKVSLRPLTMQQKLRWGFVAVLVVLGVITGTVTSPIMIYWFSAYFNNGQPCYTKAETATAGCKMALSKLAIFSGWFSSTSGFINFFVQPIMGRLSDTVGRRRVWMAAALVGSVQPAVLFFSQTSVLKHTPYMWFYFMIIPLSGFAGGIGNAYIADIMPPEWRGIAFSTLMAVSSASQVLGPLVDLIHFPGSGDPMTMYYYPFLICFIGQSVCVLLIVFFLEETLPPEKRMPMEADIFNSIKQFSILFTGPKGISDPRLFKSLAFILMVNVLANDGRGLLVGFYVKNRFAPTKAENTMQIEINGIGGLFAQMVLFRPMMAVVGPKHTIMFAITVNFLYFLAYAVGFVDSWMRVYGMIAFGTFGYVAYPAITMIKSQKCDADEQGRVMGALSAAMQLANGIGVLFFSHTYAWLLKMHPEPQCDSVDLPGNATFCHSNPLSKDCCLQCDAQAWSPDCQAKYPCTTACNATRATAELVIRTIPSTDSVWCIGIAFAFAAAFVCVLLPDPREVFINIRRDIQNARNRRLRGGYGRIQTGRRESHNTAEGSAPWGGVSSTSQDSAQKDAVAGEPEDADEDPQFSAFRSGMVGVPALTAG